MPWSDPPRNAPAAAAAIRTYRFRIVRGDFSTADRACDLFAFRSFSPNSCNASRFFDMCRVDEDD